MNTKPWVNVDQVAQLLAWLRTPLLADVEGRQGTKDRAPADIQLSEVNERVRANGADVDLGMKGEMPLAKIHNYRRMNG